MCGIAGSSGTHTFDPWVDEALDLMARRGPDGRGRELACGVTHGHVRLAVRDTTPKSAQPFVTWRSLLSYSGELWNADELRGALKVEGCRFETRGDTEVVARALDTWGPEQALTAFDGQFALAWTDTRSGRTILARDRQGELPLYVLESRMSILEPDAVRWASERKAFGDRGAEAEAVPAGAFVELGASWIQGVTRFSAQPGWINQTTHVDPEYVLELLRAAVRRRLLSDVPVCFLASGGLDSTLILRLVLDELRDGGNVRSHVYSAGPRVRAYCAHLQGRESADLNAALEVCQELGVDLRVVPIVFGAQDAVETIEISMKAQVEIAGACMSLARQMHEDGFKVCLSGEGADELFGGYGNLARKSATDMQWFRARLDAIHKMARGNCVRTNKSFMRFSVEARLPFLDSALIDAVLPLGVSACPPHKVLLREVARAANVPQWVIDQPKRTFQGAAGVDAYADEFYEGQQIKAYNDMARRVFGGIPRG